MTSLVYEDYFQDVYGYAKRHLIILLMESLQPRISMNLSMILQSNKIFLLIPNKNKLDVYKEAKNNKKIPLYFLLNQIKNKINIITA